MSYLWLIILALILVLFCYHPEGDKYINNYLLYLKRLQKGRKDNYP